MVGLSVALSVAVVGLSVVLGVVIIQPCRSVTENIDIVSCPVGYFMLILLESLFHLSQKPTRKLATRTKGSFPLIAKPNSQARCQRLNIQSQLYSKARAFAISGKEVSRFQEVALRIRTQFNLRTPQKMKKN